MAGCNFQNIFERPIQIFLVCYLDWLRAVASCCLAREGGYSYAIRAPTASKSQTRIIFHFCKHIQRRSHRLWGRSWSSSSSVMVMVIWVRWFLLLFGEVLSHCSLSLVLFSSRAHTIRHLRLFLVYGAHLCRHQITWQEENKSQKVAQ